MQVKYNVPQQQGFEWLKQGWSSYRLFPAQWTLIIFVAMGASYLFGAIIPLVGFILGDLVQTLLGIGAYRSFLALKKEQKFRWDLLIVDFKNFDLITNLILMKTIVFLSLIGVTATLLGVDLYLGITTKDFLSLAQIINTKTFYLIPDTFMKLLLMNMIVLGLWVLSVFAATTFAPLLMVVHGASPIKALWMSLKINFGNVGALAVLALLSILVTILAALPLLLGMFVALPVLSLSLMAAFKELTGDHELPPETALTEPTSF